MSSPAHNPSTLPRRRNRRTQATATVTQGGGRNSTPACRPATEVVSADHTSPWLPTSSMSASPLRLKYQAPRSGTRMARICLPTRAVNVVGDFIAVPCNPTIWPGRPPIRRSPGWLCSPKTASTMNWLLPTRAGAFPHPEHYIRERNLSASTNEHNLRGFGTPPMVITNGVGLINCGIPRGARRTPHLAEVHWAQTFSGCKEKSRATTTTASPSTTPARR